MNGDNATSAEKDVTERTVVGIVVSDKRKKTITVSTSHISKHPRYGKFISRSTHFHAHDEKNEAKFGDRVEIRRTRPLSKQKHWRLVRVLDRAVLLGSLDIKEVELAPKTAPAAAGEGSPLTPASEAGLQEKKG